MLLVYKKDGIFKMCRDYRDLNKINLKIRFPIPMIEGPFDKLQGAIYFSRIDLKSGYHQIQMVPLNIHETILRTMFGLLKYLVMPFGLTNAPRES